MFSKQQIACNDLLVMLYKVPNEESEGEHLCNNSQWKALAIITSASDKHLGKIKEMLKNSVPYDSQLIQYIEQGGSYHSRLKSILNYFIKR
jgi:hypothetical protein